MAKHVTPSVARTNKNDEFYTQLYDIEKELQNYLDHFQGKVVYCNCDNPEKSNFWKYFFDNFDTLGLKQLISSHYHPEEQVYSLEYDGTKLEQIYLRGNGDFRSAECVELLKKADIVVTNPPFSLFRSFVSQMIEYNKKFLIIGNQNALTYKEIFPLIKENKLWYGPSISSGDRTFNVPDDYPLAAAGCGVDENGEKYIKVKGVRWFTNLDHQGRHEPIPLTEKYDPEKYPTYDNYDAINVNKTVDIPCDYDGVMGVPITFIDKYCPEQFEILGCTANPESNDVLKRPRSEKAVKLIKEGRLKNAKCVGGNSNIFIDKDDYVHVLYHRLLIRKK